jgi:site-specific DNA-methyltransferase (adenine-specific)
MTVTLHTGDCLDVMAAMEPDSVDSIVTDPPYGLAFMGKDWDHGVPGIPFWEAALRVAKPGAHLLAFGGTRTFHRLAVAIEDAGWELRDTVMWVYGSGFPKSHDVSKAIDRAAGAEREVVGPVRWQGRDPNGKKPHTSVFTDDNWVGKPDTERGITAPATPDAERWAGWGTALKPAWEPVIVARKPFPCTVAANVLAWGTGAINVDGCRVGTEQTVTHGKRNGTGNSLEWSKTTSPEGWQGTVNAGRWPANLVHDGSDEVLALFPVSDARPAKAALNGTGSGSGHTPGNGWGMKSVATSGFTDTGSAARFFPAFAHDAEDIEAARFMYCAKASRADRDDGLEGMEARVKLRDDLTPEQREYVMAELKRHGVKL